jgi:hypothetical protein
MKHFIASLLIGLFTNNANALLSPTRVVDVDKTNGVFTFRNLVTNDGFEKGTRGWTASGGTFTTTSTFSEIGQGSRAGSWDSSAASQTLTSTAVPIPAGDYGANYEVSANLECATGTCTHTIQAFDGTNPASPIQTITSSTTYTRTTVNFVAGISGSLSVRISSVNANEPTLYVDDVYLGRARNIGSVAQAQLVGSILWPKTTNCLWARTSNSTFGSFSADADCTTPTGSQLVGSAIAPATKIPAISFSNLSPGRYTFIAQGAFNSGGAFQCGFSITDGTRRTTPVYSSSSGTAGQITGFIDISTATSSTTTFEVQASGNGTNGECQVNNTPNNPDMGDMSIQVYRFPSSSEIAVRPELQNKFAQSVRNSNGSGIFSTSSTSWVDVSDASFATPTFTGSAIAGSNANDIVLRTQNVPAGTYYVGFTGSMASNSGPSQCAFGLFDGTTRFAQAQVGNAASGNDARISNIGGFITYSAVQSDLSIKLQTIRISGTGTCQLNLSASAGVLNGTFYMIPVSQSLPVPVLVGSVTSQSAGAERIERVSFGGASETSVCSSSPCTIYRQSGSWVSSITRSGTGNYVVNIVSGIFASKPSCALMVDNNANVIAYSGSNSNSSTSLAIQSANMASSGVDVALSVICQGPRGSL